MNQRAIICIGGSAGAIDALTEILSKLARDFPVPLAAVLHRHVESGDVLIRLLHSGSAPALSEPFDKQPLTTGGLFLAPSDYHLLVDQSRFRLTSDEPEHFARPSINPLFRSAAVAFGVQATAIVLSGANTDGAIGAAAIQARSGRVIVQDPDTASHPKMPKASLQRVPDAIVAAPAAIAAHIMSVCTSKRGCHV